MPSADNSSAAAAQALSGRIPLVRFPPSSVKPLRTSSSRKTSPNWRTPRGDAPAYPVDSLIPVTARGTTMPSSRVMSSPRVVHDMSVSSNQLSQLKTGVSARRDFIAAAPVFGDSTDIAHVHPFLAGHIAAVVPGVAGRVNKHGRRDQRGGVIDPLLLRAGQRLDGANSVGAQVRDAVTDPLDMLFKRGDEVRGRARAARTLDREQVRESGDPQPEIGQRPLAGPELAERHCFAAADINAAERTGHGVESGGVDDHVEFVAALLGADTGRRHVADRPLAQVDECDVVAVECLVVALVDD